MLGLQSAVDQTEPRLVPGGYVQGSPRLKYLFGGKSTSCRPLRGSFGFHNHRSSSTSALPSGRLHDGPSRFTSSKHQTSVHTSTFLSIFQGEHWTSSSWIPPSNLPPAGPIPQTKRKRHGQVFLPPSPCSGMALHVRSCLTMPCRSNSLTFHAYRFEQNVLP